MGILGRIKLFAGKFKVYIILGIIIAALVATVAKLLVDSGTLKQEVDDAEERYEELSSAMKQNQRALDVANKRANEYREKANDKQEALRKALSEADDTCLRDYTFPQSVIDSLPK